MTGELLVVIQKCVNVLINGIYCFFVILFAFTVKNQFTYKSLIFPRFTYKRPMGNANVVLRLKYMTFSFYSSDKWEPGDF